MKMMKTLSTSALALLVSMSVSYGSLSEESIDGESAANISSTAPQFDPKDYNKDGKVTFGEEVLYFFDKDHDGDIDGHDFKLLINSIFDRDHDGDIDGDDARFFLGELKGALGKFTDITTYLKENLSDFRESEIFSFLPEKFSGPLGDLLDLVINVSTKLGDGVAIGVGYVGEIEAKLDIVESKIKKLKKANLTKEQLFVAKSEIAKILKVSETLVDTDDNISKVNKMYKKLADLKPTA